MTLQQEMAQLLVEMALLQHGSTVSYNPSGSGQPESRAPSGDGRPMADRWRDEWVARPYRETVDAARKELDAWKKRQDPAEDKWDERQAILDDGEGFHAGDVARRFQRSVTYVMKVREKDDRDVEYGRLKSEVAVTSVQRREDQRVRVVSLAAQGCTLRQIEMQTNVPRETVRRWLKEAA